MRGKVLAIEFKKRLKNMERLQKEVEIIDPKRNSKIKDKLKSALDALKLDVDQNRFEQELIYYLEKYDITEEKVRLKNHINYFKNTLKRLVNQMVKKARFYCPGNRTRN